jgi:hypothetical protein
VHAKPFLLIAGIGFGFSKRRNALNPSTERQLFTVVELICTTFSWIPLFTDNKLMDL